MVHDTLQTIFHLLSYNLKTRTGRRQINRYMRTVAIKGWCVCRLLCGCGCAGVRANERVLSFHQAI